MTVFRPDTSFPYLKIAREFGVDYGDVIRVADMWRRPTLMTPEDLVSFRRIEGKPNLLLAISDAADAEEDRRRDVRHGRG